MSSPTSPSLGGHAPRSLRGSNPLLKVRDLAQFRHKTVLGCALEVKEQISEFALIAQNYAVRLSEFVRKSLSR
jgi:hypothetical protein